LYPSFSAKNNQKKFLPLVLGATLPIGVVVYLFIKNPQKEYNDYAKNPLGLTLAMIFFLSMVFYSLYKYLFDNKIKLTIDMDGLWSSQFGLIKWESVWYIYHLEIQDRNSKDHRIIIKLNEDDKELKIDPSYLDKTPEHIVEALKYYSKSYKVIFLDKEIQNG
jgi:hypothetical protein